MSVCMCVYAVISIVYSVFQEIEKYHSHIFYKIRTKCALSGTTIFFFKLFGIN